jgi:hypothetical protein
MESDLDVFVEQGAALTSFETYLCQQENYCLESTKDKDTYTMRGLAQVRITMIPADLAVLDADHR